MNNESKNGKRIFFGYQAEEEDISNILKPPRGFSGEVDSESKIEMATSDKDNSNKNEK